jgi:hypothetical protein
LPGATTFAQVTRESILSAGEILGLPAGSVSASPGDQNLPGNTLLRQAFS